MNHWQCKATKKTMFTPKLNSRQGHATHICQHTDPDTSAVTPNTTMDWAETQIQLRWHREACVCILGLFGKLYTKSVTSSAQLCSIQQRKCSLRKEAKGHLWGYRSCAVLVACLMMQSYYHPLYMNPKNQHFGREQNNTNTLTSKNTMSFSAKENAPGVTLCITNHQTMVENKKHVWIDRGDEQRQLLAQPTWNHSKALRLRCSAVSPASRVAPRQQTNTFNP